MNPILKKMAYKYQDPLLILNAPTEFTNVIKDIEASVHTKESAQYGFIIIFSDKIAEAKTLIERAFNHMTQDCVIWLCYPKMLSKKYKSEFNREKFWEFFLPYGYESVTQVSIDNDWSALRFKKSSKVKNRGGEKPVK